MITLFTFEQGILSGIKFRYLLSEAIGQLGHYFGNSEGEKASFKEKQYETGVWLHWPRQILRSWLILRGKLNGCSCSDLTVKWPQHGCSDQECKCLKLGWFNLAGKWTEHCCSDPKCKYLNHGCSDMASKWLEHCCSDSDPLGKWLLWPGGIGVWTEGEMLLKTNNQ